MAEGNLSAGLTEKSALKLATAVPARSEKTQRSTKNSNGESVKSKGKSFSFK